MATDILSEPTAPGFDDPIAMLCACHRRIERQLATLARLQRHLPENGVDADASAAARAILKYFDNAAPNHDADEERSLFPRLADATEAKAIIDDLRREHRTLADQWRKLRPALAAIASGRRGNLSPRQVQALTAAYEAHIGREERELLPLAARILDAATLRAVGEEMAARRGVDMPEAPRSN